MPTQDWGVYQDSLTLGTEVSSTYEGRHITATAAELNHGNVLAVVTKGYPVIFDIVAGAHGVGVAFNTEVAGTDLIAVDTEGIWNLSVVSSDDAGNSLVVAGDPLYINTTTAVISKIRNNATQIPFGYALSQGNGDGLAHTCAVKVHWDPRSHWLEDIEPLYFGDLRDVNIAWDTANLVMLPLVDNTGIFQIGNGTLSMDVQIFGLTAASYLLWDNSENTLDLISALAGAATQDSMSITTADAVAGAGLLGRGLFINYDNNGVKTGAQAESNGLGINMDADADVTGLFGINVYTAGLTGATINRVAAYTCYLDEVAGTVTAASCIHLETAVQAATVHDYISMRSHALQQGMITCRSGGDVATYFLVFDPALVAPCQAFNAAGNGDYSIACYINGELTYLHTYDAP